jgi:hypothetical protein
MTATEDATISGLVDLLVATLGFVRGSSSRNG